MPFCWIQITRLYNVGSPLLGRKMRSLFISIVKVLNNDYRNGVNSDLPSSDTIDNISS